MAETRAERRLHAQVAAFHSWAATTDRAARTAKARAALAEKFLAEADGDPVRAEALRRAHYAAMSLKSSVARRRIKEATADAEAAERALAELSGEGGDAA